MPMINFDAQMFDYSNNKPWVEPIPGVKNGEIVVTGERPFTFKMAAIRACMNALKGDEDKIDDGAFSLGVKLSAGGDINLTTDELVLLQDRFNKYYTAPSMRGQMRNLLNKENGNVKK